MSAEESGCQVRARMYDQYATRLQKCTDDGGFQCSPGLARQRERGQHSAPVQQQWSRGGEHLVLARGIRRLGPGQAPALAEARSALLGDVQAGKGKSERTKVRA